MTRVVLAATLCTLAACAGEPPPVEGRRISGGTVGSSRTTPEDRGDGAGEEVPGGTTGSSAPSLGDSTFSGAIHGERIAPLGQGASVVPTADGLILRFSAAGGRGGRTMAVIQVGGGGLDHPALAPGNEHTVAAGEPLEGGLTIDVLGCWSAPDSEAWDYDAPAETVHVKVAPGEAADEVEYTVTADLPPDETTGLRDSFEVTFTTAP